MNSIASQLGAAGVKVFPCRPNKHPAVGKGVNWADIATTDVSTLQWPSELVGVPIPPDVLVIDLDLYKGVTRQSVEQALGCPLSWDLALVQRTAGGGEHYAFHVDWEAIQGSDLLDIPGFDTRAAQRGYICSGAGYTWQGFGLMRLAAPGSLPPLPQQARQRLERVRRDDTSVKHVDLPQDDRNVGVIRDALRYIDADCSRAEWVHIGMGLKHHFHDMQDVGYALFKEWSEYAPERLDYDSLEPQWDSFKPENTDGPSVTIASIIYKAMQAGYSPPVSFDTASAFGEGAAPIEVYAQLVDRIIAEGGDPKNTDLLIGAINALSCSTIQRATLSATLHRELKEAGLLTVQVKKSLERAVSGVALGENNPPGMYGKKHMENAALFLEKHYPNNTLVRCRDDWYSYDGRVWSERSKSEIEYELTLSMSRANPQDSTINSTYSLLAKICHTSKTINEVSGDLIHYANGILDLPSGDLYPHSQDYFSTSMLPYNFNYQATCPTWLGFLDNIFEGDHERINLLQEWFGYMMASSYLHQKLMLMIGPSRSGKGTIGKVLEQLVGDVNFAGGSLQSLTSDSMLAILVGKRVMFIGDAEQNIPRHIVSSVIERIKTITGNDVVSFDRKFKSALSLSLPTRITLATNSLPRLFDDSGALAGRFLILPFSRSFLGREDLNLFDKLMQDIEGIAMWALEGLRRLNHNGQFTVSQLGQEELEYVRENYSPLKRFIDEICKDGDKVTCEELHNAYHAWAVKEQETTILTRRPFISAFKDATRGRFRYSKMRADGKSYWGFHGISLNDIEGGGLTERAFKVVDK